MMKKKPMILLSFMVVVCLLFTVSCANKGLLLGSVNERMVERIKEDSLKHECFLAKKMFVNESIIFNLNSSELLSISKKLLNRKADWLISHPDAIVVIEGHCDYLGNDSYNLILGEKRAKSVKKFMVGLGIEEDRMKIISYGEGEPVDTGETEEQLVKNRRVRFCLVE